ncbi:nucleophile aminohydrolase [Vibrio phage 1.085.O._10N.222.51.E3]|nr:nucleophile aminohydrolase [Vibrio phage 1.085.O._10N.222.51.E3]AUR89681.1 nucleophile aminohydrolase [Vibrio phage 1.131.O._10N.222.49.A8]
MTTIAYHHESGIIAYESRLTRSGTICSDDFEKSFEKDGITFVMTGSIADQQQLIADYPSFSADYVYRCHGVMIMDREAYSFCFNDNQEFEAFKLSFNEAWGSGSDHALTAMDCGKSSSEAVELAISRDCNSGGKVRQISVFNGMG